MDATVIARFHNGYVPEPNTGCWLWLGALDRNGYGRHGSGGKACYAHRISYEIHRGVVPPGEPLDHLCRIRSCVNPWHLEIVSPLMNVRRSLVPKITAKQARDIFVDPRPVRTIAADYGIAFGTVLQIQLRDTWRDATAGLSLHPSRLRRAKRNVAT